MIRACISKKDPLRTNSARKEAGHTENKATIRTRHNHPEDFYGDLTETRKVHNDGSAVKTLFVGSILRGHRGKAERFDKRNLMHSSQAAWCHLTGIERVITQHSDLQHQDLHRVFSKVLGMNSSNSSGWMF